MNLVIDSGNTKAKVGLFDTKGGLIDSPEDLDITSLRNYVEDIKPLRIGICSVSIDPLSIAKMLPDPDLCLIIDYKTPLPIRVGYETPETLGIDRLAAAVGAVELKPGQNCLIIDMGTTITYDFVDHQGVFRGGSISPGLKLRFKALSHYTANLPEVDLGSEIIELTGKSTKNSILSGVFWGIVSEIDGFIRFYQNKIANLQIILCGGDAKRFEPKINSSTIVVPELVLRGLNGILNHNG